MKREAVFNHLAYYANGYLSLTTGLVFVLLLGGPVGYLLGGWMLFASVLSFIGLKWLK